MTTEPATTKSPSLAGQVSQAIFWNTLFVPLRMIAEVAATVIKLAVLPLASYGLLALVSAASNGLGTWIDLGTARALPKYIPETNRSGGPPATRRLLTAVLAAQFGMLLLICGALLLSRDRYVADLRAKVLGDARLDLAAQAELIGFVERNLWLLIGAIVALLFLGICYDVLMAYLNSFFKQRAWNAIALAAGLLPPVLSVIAVLALPDDQKITGVLTAMVLAPLIAVVLVGGRVRRLRRELATGTPTGDDGRVLPTGFLTYCGVSFLMTATDFLASKGFAVFLVSDISEVALVWAGASVVSMVLSYLYTPMAGVQVPLFTRVRAGEGGTLPGAYQTLTRLLLMLLVPGAVGLMLLAAPTMSVLAPRYGDSVPLILTLVPLLFLESLLSPAHNALIVYERHRTIIISRLLTLAVVPLALLLPPILGIVGAALAFGVARLMAGLWVTGSGFRTLGLRWPWRFTLRVLLASGVMAVAVALLGYALPQLAAEASPLQRLLQAGLLVGVAAAGGAVFLGALRLLGGLDPRDRQMLGQMKLPLKRWVLRIV